MERLVVKVGSNVLSREDGTLDITRMSAIVDQIVALRRKGYEVILVSSGAVACGRSILKVQEKLDSVEQRQLFSAVGQVRLINFYHEFFKEYGVNIGQVLTMKECFASEEAYQNQHACMNVMLHNKVVPIINENDTVSITELMFTDNDELAGLMATMMKADTLVILTNVDGIYDGVPGEEGVKVIEKVMPGEDLSSVIQSSKSGLGRGGMTSKYSIAQKVASEGTRVLIANGKKDDILLNLFGMGEEVIHTEFFAAK